MPDPVIVGYARTPIGKLGGGLSSLTAMELGGVAVRAALAAAGVDGDRIDSVALGHVLQAGQGQITARQAAVLGGIPLTVPSTTVNKVCLSGVTAVGHAARLLRGGEADLVLAGGMESMSSAPYLLPGARTGYRMGNGELVDAMIHDGLWDAFAHHHMGEGSDVVNDTHGISREAQDEWSAMSHERAVAAWKDGRFTGEVVPVEVPQRRGEGGRQAAGGRGSGRGEGGRQAAGGRGSGKGDPLVVDTDEGMRPGTTTESLGRLRPAFRPDGTITAGNASQISDGAAALVLATEEKAAELGLEPLGRVLAYAEVAGPGPDTSLHHQPAEAIRKASARLGADPGGYDLYEMNEAFASVAIHSAGLLGVGPERVNVNGGAVALGHPIGCTGARIVVTLLHELRNRGGGRGAAALCGGGGQGDALIVETA